MFYLIITILLNTLLFAMFKVFARYKVDNLQAIIVNYFVCVITGSIFLGEFPVSTGSINQPWLPWAILMGVMFISIFNLVAWRTVKDGLTTATIANKLSMVIPVIFSIALYNEKLTVVKLMGIILAFPAVYFTTRVKGDDTKPQSIFFPVLLFISSGLLDTLITFVERTFLNSAPLQAAFTIHVFTAASLLGASLIAILKWRKNITLHPRNIIAGIILGVPNYFSIYFLIRLLNSGFLQSSAAIPVNNIGIVLLTAITSILIFKEKITRQRLIGLALSIIAILLIAIADLNGGKI